MDAEKEATGGATDGQKQINLIKLKNTPKNSHGQELIETAQNFLGDGLSVIPCNPETKRPILEAWKPYQTNPISGVNSFQWPGIAIICGKVSGNLECLDFDFQAGWFDDWARLVTGEAPDLINKVLIQKTQSGGLHIVCRCSDPVPGNQKLATDSIQVEFSETYQKDGKRFFPFQGKELEAREVNGKLFVYPCFIETRGQGGYFLAAPTPGYTITQGSFTDLPVLSASERAILINSARALSQKKPEPERITYHSNNCDRRPGDLFNERGEALPILEQHGWKYAGTKGSITHLTRPGKDKGVSASLFDGKVLHVFSSNALPFEPERSYSPFSVFALLKHGGDFEAAARELAGQGCGEPPQPEDDDPGPCGSKGNTTDCTDFAGRVETKSGNPEPLPDELLPVATFDFELFPDSLRPWAEDVCDRMQCPPDFVAVGIMAALAGIIGRKVGIRPQARTDWTVVCNMWALIVGRPGVFKSPALDQTLIPLKRLQAKNAEQFQQDEKVYQAEVMATKLKKEAAEKRAREILKKDPNADLFTVLAVPEVAIPTLKRLIANDTSPASLGELLRQNPNGLLIFRDEIVGLLKSLDREGQEEGRSFYLTAWNGDSAYTFDRIGRGLNLHIPAVCLSVLGGTQPGRLSEYIRHAVKGGAADDGLIQRFGLLVWPDTNGSWKDVDRWPDSDAKKQANKVFDYLHSLDPLMVGASQDVFADGNPDGISYLRFDAASLELFQEWRSVLEKKLREDLHPALESHFAKYRKLIPAIALICHLADYGTGPVSEKATLRALAWGEYLETHAQRAYGSVSQPEISVAKAIIRRIKKGDLPPTFSNWEVWRPGWAKLTDRDQIKEAIRLLEEYNWLFKHREATGGRPKTTYTVNKEALA